MPTEIGKLTFYTVEELSKKFKVSPVTVYEYIKSGKLPAKRFGRKYQISQDTVEKYLTEVAVAE
ncbi:MAG: helix-turn-helix domain-containing protein [Elusimicrobia bacterium]|nr:helix-turn-helix domain-containing protein [Elusimicrobiota bacterium]